MKRFLTLLATGALALGFATSASAQVRGLGAGALILDDNQNPFHTITVETPQFGTAEWTAWQSGGFQNLWIFPVPPFSSPSLAQAGFVLSGPLSGTVFPTPLLSYWLPPGQTTINGGGYTGGTTGTWDYATTGELGLLTSSCSGITNRIPVWTSASTICNSSISDNGVTISTTEPLSVGGGSANITDAGLIAGDVVYSGAGGLLSTDNTFTWNHGTTTLTVTGIINSTGNATIATGTTTNTFGDGGGNTSNTIGDNGLGGNTTTTNTIGNKIGAFSNVTNIIGQDVAGGGVGTVTNDIGNLNTGGGTVINNIGINGSTTNINGTTNINTTTANSTNVGLGGTGVVAIGNSTGFVGIGLNNPFSMFSNTTFNIVDPAGNGETGPSLTWSMASGGYVAAFDNNTGVGPNDNGVEIKVLDNTKATTTALDVSSGASPSSDGTQIFGAYGNGNVVIDPSYAATTSIGNATAATNVNITGGNKWSITSTGAITATSLNAGAGLITTSGNIQTTGSGTITSAGLLTANSGATITGTTTLSGANSPLNVNGTNGAANSILESNGGTLTPSWVSGASLFIQNQNASQQNPANFWISGNGRLDGALTVGGLITGGSFQNTGGSFTATGTGAITATSLNAGSGLVTTSGNIQTTGSGTITSAGLLTANSGATITGTTTLSGANSPLNVNGSNGAANSVLESNGGTLTPSWVSGASLFIQNQNASQQNPANFWISGNGEIDGTLTVEGTTNLATASGTVGIGGWTFTPSGNSLDLSSGFNIFNVRANTDDAAPGQGQFNVYLDVNIASVSPSFTVTAAATDVNNALDLNGTNVPLQMNGTNGAANSVLESNGGTLTPSWVSGASLFIQNQNASQQNPANFWISGNGRLDGALTVGGLITGGSFQNTGGSFIATGTGAITATSLNAGSGLVTTSGNIQTTGSGTITSAGLLTANSGATITGTTTLSGANSPLNVNGSNGAANSVLESNGGTLTPSWVSGASLFIQNQNASQQNPANFWISGNGEIDGTLKVEGATSLATSSGFVGIGLTNPVSLLANTPTNTLGSDIPNQGGTGLDGFQWAVPSSLGYAATIYNAGALNGSDGLEVKVGGTNANTYVLDVSEGAVQNVAGTPLFNVRASGDVNIDPSVAAITSIGNSTATVNVSGATNINTGNNDLTKIGEIGANNSSTTINVGNTGALTLNNIPVSTTTTNFLTQDGAGKVWTNSLSNFIVGNNGVLVTYPGGIATAQLGAANTDVPFSSDRFVNLDASNLNFTTNGGALNAVQITGGANPGVNIAGPLAVNFTTADADGTYYGVNSTITHSAADVINLVGVSGTATGTDDQAIGLQGSATGTGTNIALSLNSSGGGANWDVLGTGSNWTVDNGGNMFVTTLTLPNLYKFSSPDQNDLNLSSIDDRFNVYMNTDATGTGEFNVYLDNNGSPSFAATSSAVSVNTTLDIASGGGNDISGDSWSVDGSGNINSTSLTTGTVTINASGLLNLNGGNVPLQVNGDQGSGGFLLTSNGANNTPQWSDPSETLVTSLQGTANEVLVNTTSGIPTTGAITLTTPQDIGSSSNVQFAELGLGQAPGPDALDVTGNIGVTGNVTPSADVSYNLGSPTDRWQEVYVGPGSLNIVEKTTDFGNTGTAETWALGANASGSLTIGSGANDLTITPAGSVSFPNAPYTTNGVAHFTGNNGTISSSLIVDADITSGTISNGSLQNSSLTVTAGTGLTGGGTVSLGGTTTLNLANTAVTTGTYGDATHSSTITVDQQGRITSASNTLITGTTPGGAAGGDLSGTYPDPTVAAINGATLGSTTATDKNILIANGTSWVSQPVTGDVTISDLGAVTIANGAVTNAKLANSSITINNGNGMTGGGTISLGNSITFGLANNGVASGSYGDATHVGTFTVNPQGQLTVASSVLITGTTPGGTAGGDLSGTYPDPTVAAINGATLGSTTATDKNILIANGTSWVSQPVTGDVTISDAGATTISNGAVTNADLAHSSLTVAAGTGLTGGGAVSLGGTTTFNLANTAVTTGTYGDATHSSTITVDQQGRITSASNTPITGTTPGGAAGGDLSGTYPDPTVSAINGATLGSTTATDKNILIANGTSWVSQPVTGDVTISDAGATTISNGAVTNADLAHSTLTVASGTGLTGGGAVSLGGTTTLSLANTSVTANSYGDATHVGAFTVNAQGQLTSASSVAITGTTPGGAAGGDLSGTYPNPTVAAINGATLGSTTATDKNILIANGTSWVSQPVTGDVTISDAGATTISNGAVTNADLAHSSLTVAAGTGLTGGGAVSLGGTTTLNLANTAVTTGTYGDATHSSTITVDQQGRITSASNTPITGTTPGGAAGGDLSGTYPDPTVSAINGATLGSTTTTDKNILIANGTSWVSEPVGGDVTISDVGNVTIANGAVSNAKLANSSITINNGNGMTGGGTISLGNSITFGLANSGVSSATYGDATHVGQFHVNAQGQLTSASSVLITGTAPGGAATGDLAGNYPGPTIATGAGPDIITALTTSNGTITNPVATSGNISTTGTGTITSAGTLTASGNVVAGGGVQYHFTPYSGGGNYTALSTDYYINVTNGTGVSMPTSPIGPGQVLVISNASGADFSTGDFAIPGTLQETTWSFIYDGSGWQHIR